MSVTFCWEYKKCDRPCPVRDMRLLFCWAFFAEEAAAGRKDCAGCAYREAWNECNTPARAPADRSATARKTILVIDDEPNILYALEETVSSRGCRCVAATDGEEGIEIARRLLPDLIISDIIMPRINGYELCHILKRDEATKHIPIILVTVKVGEKDRLEGGLAGADYYLFKPFKLARLKEAIDRFL
jgi:twitching motility two-component system response regulator PilH